MKLSAKQLAEINIFSPLAEGLSLQIQNVISGKNTSAGVHFLGTSFKPYPYVQVGLPDERGQLTLEVISNTFLETKLTEWQVDQLVGAGWNAPDKTNPNFWMVVTPEETLELAKVLIYAAHLVFGIRPDTWFSFGTAPSEVAINNSGLYWRRRGAEGVVCLPGQNKDETLEGSV